MLKPPISRRSLGIMLELISIGGIGVGLWYVYWPAAAIVVGLLGLLLAQGVGNDTAAPGPQ